MTDRTGTGVSRRKFLSSGLSLGVAGAALVTSPALAAPAAPGKPARSNWTPTTTTAASFNERFDNARIEGHCEPRLEPVWNALAYNL
ncbi:MAG: hypothetical protein ABUU24_01255, partial [Variovorax sp.]